jgi:hypothetical protein
MHNGALLMLIDDSAISLLPQNKDEDEMATASAYSHFDTVLHSIMPKHDISREFAAVTRINYKWGPNIQSIWTIFKTFINCMLKIMQRAVKAWRARLRSYNFCTCLLLKGCTQKLPTEMTAQDMSCFHTRVLNKSNMFFTSTIIVNTKSKSRFLVA